MTWIKCSDECPKEGWWLVSFLLEMPGSDTAFEDRRHYAKGHFNPETGWVVENDAVAHYLFVDKYRSCCFRVTHWQVLEEPPLDACYGSSWEMKSERTVYPEYKEDHETKRD